MPQNIDKTLIVIAGPTGSGKSDLAVELAARFGSPIISTDSRQVFRGMAIGTAQPTEAQLAAVRHYFIADREVTDDYTAGRFEKEALELLEQLWADHRYVIAAGGSGLYIDALCKGFDPLPLADDSIRSELKGRLAAEGLVNLLRELEKLDPEYYAEVDRNNPARVMRALEVCRASGKPFSQQRSGEKAGRDFRIVKIGVAMSREELYRRIIHRVDAMVEAGLEDEARWLYPMRALNSLQTLGYREFFEYFDGLLTREKAIELVKRNSRRYAKRQMTWFNRDAEINWFDKKSVDEIEIFIKKFAE